MTSPKLPPIQRSISVSWDQRTAFDRFTLEFAAWWPVRTHSIGGERTKRIVFEPHEGGRIYEDLQDGQRFQWGQVLVWDPPHRVKFTWHPARDPSTAQEVDLAFVAEGNGTRLNLIASAWENWGPKAQRARKGYGIGWTYVLNVWAGRRTNTMALLDGVVGVLNLMQKVRGGREAEIARAGGRILP